MGEMVIRRELDNVVDVSSYSNFDSTNMWHCRKNPPRFPRRIAVRIAFAPSLLIQNTLNYRVKSITQQPKSDP